ncbi:MAG: tetratricopeptide repeat protein [Oligoflexia bacterium]|nr:tetratricopeptide repeat protein [Oligoflexia bacterium]
MLLYHFKNNFSEHEHRCKFFLCSLLMIWILFGCSSTDKRLDHTEARLTEQQVPLNSELKAKVNSDVVLSDFTELCRQKKFDLALAQLKENYYRFKDNPEYWTTMGSCYYLQDNLSLAKIYYNKALLLNPNYLPVVNNLGILLLRQEKDQKAMMVWERILNSKYSDVSLISANTMLELRTLKLNLAKLYMKYFFVDKALALLLELQTKFPSDVQVVGDLASAYLLKNMGDKAIALYQKIDELVVLKPEMALNYVWALKMNGRLEEAKKIFERIEKIDELKDVGLERYYQETAKLL